MPYLCLLDPDISLENSVKFWGSVNFTAFHGKVAKILWLAVFSPLLQLLLPFYGFLDLVWDNPGEPVPEETFTHWHLSWSSISLICFLHLLRSMASSLFNLCTWQSFTTISLQVFFGLSFGLAPSTSYSIHFFTQSLSSFCSTCSYHHNRFCCVTEIIHLILVSLSTPYSELYLVALMPHIHLTILISACWSAIWFSFLKDQVSFPCSILLCTQMQYNLPLTISHISWPW